MKSKLLFSLLVAGAMMVAATPAWAESQTLPYSTSFETLEGYTTGTGHTIHNGWTMGNRQLPTGNSYIPYISDGYVNKKPKALTGINEMYLQAYKSINTINKTRTVYADSAYAIMPAMNFDGGITNYRVKFWMRQNTTGDKYNDTLYVGIMSDPEDFSTLQIVGEAVNNTKTYQKYNVDFSTYQGGTTGYVVFLATIDQHYGGNECYGKFLVDDVTVEKTSTCAEPSNLTVTDIAVNQATVNWNKGEASKWNLHYCKSGESSWTEVENLTDTAYTLTGLDGCQTTYQVRVQAVPALGSGAWTDMVTFQTLCTPVAPATLGTISFETSEGFIPGTQRGTVDKCWKVGIHQSTNTGNMPCVDNDTAYSAHSGTNYMKIQSSTDADSAYAIMPEMYFADGIINYQMKFWMRKALTSTVPRNCNDTLYVGIMSDPEDFSTLQIVGEAVNDTTMYAEYQVNFASYTGGETGYVVFLATINQHASQTSKFGSFCIDDVIVSSTCATVTVNVNDKTMGSVSGAGKYKIDSTVTLTAVPNAGCKFKAWSNGETANPYSFVVTSDTTLTAQFEKDSFNITGISADTVMGTVTGSGRFPYGYTADLKAVANYGYHFTEWSNGEDTRAIFVTVKSDSTITAYFAKNEYTVTLTAEPDSLGKVYGAGTYNYLDTATIVAVPESGYYFLGWSNGVKANTIIMVVTSDTTLTATFGENPGTGIDALPYEENVEGSVKFLRNGQLYLRRGEVIYDAKGMRVE